MTYQSEPPAFFYVVIGLCALALCGWSLSKRRFHPASARIVILYSLALVGFSALLYAAQDQLLVPLRAEVFAHLGLYGALLLTWTLLGYTLVFLRSNGYSLPLWAGFLAMIAGLIALDSNFFNLPQILVISPQVRLYRPVFSWALLLAGWIVLMLTSVGITLRRLSNTAQTLHRNRIQHLIPLQAVFLLAGVAVFCRLLSVGMLLFLGCGVWMLAAALTHRLPDLRRLAHALLAGGLTAIFCAGVFLAGFLLLQATFGAQPVYRPHWNGVILAGCLAVVFPSLATGARLIVQRLLPEQDYQAAKILSDYGAATSNILDLGLLAAAATGFVRERLGTERGRLMLVESQGQGYVLRDVSADGETEIEPGRISVTGTIAAHFVHDRCPLTQYDLDLLPEFSSAPAAELGWFSRTGLEVYVPVLARDEWIGLLAFGPRSSRARYRDNDLMLLSALASQTAVSLQNARLVQNLKDLNEQLTSAYEALNVANQQLERLDRTKTDFINIASHELRTPLTLLLGYAEMLADDENLQRDPFYNQMISGIQIGTHRLHEIVGSMLDIAKIDSRTLDLAPKAISLPSLIRNIQGGLSPAMQERNLRFEMVELTSLPLIEADVEALQKVFDHLLVNAVKFTPDGGQIKVMQRLAPAATSPLGRDSVEVIISDTGIGIDADMQELIFVKFYHSGPVDLHSTGKTKFKGGGPGLGLAIVRGIVEAHNGRVWVESPGSDEERCPGSQFHVLLPLSQKAYTEPTTLPIERKNIALTAVVG